MERVGGSCEEFNNDCGRNEWLSPMGHSGMLYSPAFNEKYCPILLNIMVNAHCADALVCISNLRQNYAWK